jgi:antitoxin PrlF
MLKSLTLSPKGQITLPKELREKIGIRAGDEVVFTVVNGQIVMTPKSIDFNDLAGFLGNPPNGPATLDEIDAAVRQAGGRAAVSGIQALKDDAA